MSRQPGVRVGLPFQEPGMACPSDPAHGTWRQGFGEELRYGCGDKGRARDGARALRREGGATRCPVLCCVRHSEKVSASARNQI